MSDRGHSEEEAYMQLTPDAWHQNDDGNYYIDCPECGSAATLMNVVKHGRCNGYLDQHVDETELDEAAMDCTARLRFELAYVSDPGDGSAEDGEADSSESVVSSAAVTEEDTGGVEGEGEPPGADGVVDEDHSDAV